MVCLRCLPALYYTTVSHIIIHSIREWAYMYRQLAQLQSVCDYLKLSHVSGLNHRHVTVASTKSTVNFSTFAKKGTRPLTTIKGFALLHRYM